LYTTFSGIFREEEMETRKLKMKKKGRSKRRKWDA